ncbi:MAG TPA: ATPase, T2SS/T4P/T4SS family, partial [Tepidiformaceae bacterium]|nr:ATPase, T2SS/T4P/T4SS family [Tepidiformaceae bacterium]
MVDVNSENNPGGKDPLNWPGEHLPEPGSSGPGGLPAGDSQRLRPTGHLAPLRPRWNPRTEQVAPAAPAPSAPENRVPGPMLRRDIGAVVPGAPAAAASEPLAPQRAPSQVRGPRDSVTKGNPQAEAAKVRLHELLIEELEHGALDGLQPQQQREAVVRAARELIQQEGISLGGASRDELIQAVADEVLGLGPLEPLLRDASVTEVMVNDVDKIFFEQEGRIWRSPARFRDKQHVMRIIERIVAPLGRRIDESSPMVDARLPDGSRVNVTIPPVSPKAPTITIRKFRADKMRI